MLKKIRTLALLALSAGMSARLGAAEYDLGLRGGLAASLTNNYYDYQYFYSYGVFQEIGSSSLKFRLEIDSVTLHSSSTFDKYILDSGGNPVQSGTFTWVSDVAYLELPLLIKGSHAFRHVRPYFLAGTQFRFPLGSTSVIDGQDSYYFPAPASNFQDNIGLVLGGGIDFPVHRISLGFDLRYVIPSFKAAPGQSLPMRLEMGGNIGFRGL